MLQAIGPTDKNVLKTEEMLNMLEVVWGGIPPFFGRRGVSFPQRTFNMDNMFNISPILSTFCQFLS